MMVSYWRMISSILIMVLLVNIGTPIAAATDYTTQEYSVDETLYEDYCADMYAMGFTEQEIAQLSNWSQRITMANSMAEVDALMDEYTLLVADTPLALTTADAFFSPSGGTLVLDYTGSLSVWYNVIYTRVIYFSAEQVVFLQHAMYNQSILSMLKDMLDDYGISFITGAVAKKIAEKFLISSSVASSFIGGSIAFLIGVLTNLEEMDLSDAIDNSTTGKVKLEYFYYQETTSGTYINIRNYEPWNSDRIEVPQNYDYTWYEGIYSSDNIIHVHEAEYTSNTDGTHIVECNACTASFTYDCNYTYTHLSRAQHSAVCQDCGYEIVRLPCVSMYEYCGDTTSGDVHKLVCQDCGNILNSAEINCTFTYIYYGSYNGEASHVRQCTECGYQKGAPQPCDSDTPGLCNSCGGASLANQQ